MDIRQPAPSNILRTGTGTDGSAINGLILFKTFVSRAAGVAMKWPFLQAADNTCEFSQKSFFEKDLCSNSPFGSLKV
jgi:hypothetical protein